MRGRWGYAAGPSLLYVTGGAAVMKISEQWNFLGNPFLPAPPEPHSASKTAFGWTVGTGIEAMLAPNWSARAEYLFIDAGKGAALIVHPSSAEPNAMQLDHRFHVFRFGVNYLFGAANAPAATADWRGAYLGVNAGIGTSLARGNEASGLPIEVGEVNNSGVGFAGGVQAGYNWQLAERWVVGVEADISILGIDHGYQDTPAGQTRFAIAHRWYGTARGRLGYAMGPALIYATGGFAWADAKVTMDFLNTPEVSTDARRATGVVFGGGIEAALGGNWSAKLEYLNVDLRGRATVTEVGSPYTFDRDFQVFRLGLNRRWAP